MFFLLGITWYQSSDRATTAFDNAPYCVTTTPVATVFAGTPTCTYLPAKLLSATYVKDDLTEVFLLWPNGQQGNDSCLERQPFSLGSTQ